MPESTPHGSSPSLTKTILFSLLVPILAAVVFYQLDSFDPSPIPTHELPESPPLVSPLQNGRMLHGSERVGSSELLAPEDIIYDEESKVIYTGCADGWVKRVRIGDSVADSVVWNWVNTGGRPLGLAFGHNKDVVVADPDKGLLSISSDGKIRVLSTGAEGLEAKLIDGVDVAKDGMIYFTDASYKYTLKEHIWDILEGKPHGRLLSYDPETGRTTVLVSNLYFCNGVALSPDQTFVVFCETPMKRCRKYYIKGEKKGSLDTFLENMPGMPDNIKYDGEGHFWVALAAGATPAWELAYKYPFIRKIMGILEKYDLRPSMEKNGGVLAADLDGKLVAHYYDVELSMISSGLKIGDHVYLGSVVSPYMLRLNLTQYPATAEI